MSAECRQRRNSIPHAPVTYNLSGLKMGSWTLETYLGQTLSEQQLHPAMYTPDEEHQCHSQPPVKCALRKSQFGNVREKVLDGCRIRRGGEVGWGSVAGERLKAIQ